LKKRHAELLQEIREELLKSDNEQYIDLADRVYDIGEASLADLISDIDLAVIDHHVSEVQDVEGALRRIAEGSFGVCTDCSDEIGYKRLSAYWTAKRCFVCQKRYEETHAKQRHSTL
jgi:DnaK suppressor protein